MTPPSPQAGDLTAVDAVTIAVAFGVALCAPIVRRARGIRPAISGTQVTIDFLNGSVVFPFMLLIWSAFDGSVLGKLGDARISVALAGSVGLFFIIGELAKSCATPAATTARNQA